VARRTTHVSDQPARASFREVFAVAEFRALWTAQLLSVAGDQLAKVALTVLVYDRTRSAVLAAVTFAASFVPGFIGGILLSGLADRHPRRAVMIICDLVRMLLVLAMAAPGIPIPVLVGLLFAVTMIGQPFSSARAALYPEILAGRQRYATGTAVTITTFQAAQVAGFAIGGALTGLLGTRLCLLADAATFAASALIVRLGVAARPVPDAPAPRRSAVADLADGVKLVFGDPALRAPMLLGWLAAAYNSPEGVAAPLAHALDGGAVATGMLLACPAAGYMAGALTFSGLFGPRAQARLEGPLAVTCCAALITIGLRPDLPVTLLILAVSGACASYQIAANAAFVSATPPHQRSQAFGLATAGMSLLQGTAMILAGAAAQHVAPATVISAAGAVGAAAALKLTLPWPGWRTARGPGPADG
jgi:MFS family permease